LRPNPHPLGYEVDLARDVFAGGVVGDGVAVPFTEYAHQLSGSLIQPWRPKNHQLKPLTTATNLDDNLYQLISD
jgi:hypothetical protein